MTTPTDEPRAIQRLRADMTTAFNRSDWPAVQRLSRRIAQAWDRHWTWVAARQRRLDRQSSLSHSSP